MRAVRRTTTDCPTYVFTRSTVPATGPRGAEGLSCSVTLHPLRSIPVGIALKGMAVFLARLRRAVTPPKPRQRFAPPGAKGLTARSTRNDPPALIGDDHAWAASVFVHRNVVPSIHMRCRITASLRATATFARLRPRRLATSNPQRFSAEKRVLGDNSVFAAS